MASKKKAPPPPPPKKGKKVAALPSGVDPVADAAEVLPSGDVLNDLRREAQNMIDLEDQIADLDTKRKELNERLDHIVYTSLPGLMESHKLKSFETESGAKVEVESFVRAGIPTESAIAQARKKDPARADQMEERRDAALKYLRKNKAGSLIKNYVSVEFGKGTDEGAKKLIKELKSAGYEPVSEETVHAGTLVAWVREQIENGRVIPMETFNVSSGKKATISGLKKAKKEGK